MKDNKYILSQHKCVHKVKYKHFMGEVFCKCDYHGYDYTDYDGPLDTGIKICKKCFKKKFKFVF